MEVKTGICPICHKNFKLTKSGKLYLHGYKRKLKQKTWIGLITFTKTYYKLIKQPCLGTGLLPIKLEEKKNVINGIERKN